MTTRKTLACTAGFTLVLGAHSVVGALSPGVTTQGPVSMDALAGSLPPGVSFRDLYRANRDRIRRGDLARPTPGGPVQFYYVVPGPAPAPPPNLSGLTAAPALGGAPSLGGTPPPGAGSASPAVGFLRLLVQLLAGSFGSGSASGGMPQVLAALAGLFNPTLLTPMSPGAAPPASATNSGIFGFGTGGTSATGTTPGIPGGTATPAGQTGSGCPWQSHLPLAAGTYQKGSSFKDPGRSRPDYDHEGVDLMSPAGTPIYAAGNGVVERVDFSDSGYGHFLDIRHECGFHTIYAHMVSPPQDRNGRPLQPGDQLRGGDPVGLVGKTGNAKTTPPHLHFEVRHPQLASTKHGATDPAQFFTL